MDRSARLESEVGSRTRLPESQSSEQVARSEAECEERVAVKNGRTTGWLAGRNGGGASHPVAASPPPSFLVRNKDNVNDVLWAARGLITMWNFLDYKGRVGITNILLNRKSDASAIMILLARRKSRYFEEGRWHISSGIRKRLGRFEGVRGLMLTLTFDPKKTRKREAWATFGKYTRRFLNAVNQYRIRRGWHRLHYLWVVEVQRDTGYPHVHVFFPNLKWVAPVEVLNGNWALGRSNVSSPKKINTNCAAYVSKYLRKMEGWTDLHLALLWSGRSRMYGFSRGFSPKVDKAETDWQRWHIVLTEDVEGLERTLAEGGFVVENGVAKEDGIGQGRAQARSKTSTLTNSGIRE